ncbi:hypothetical protein CRE_05915 [Caenorhabditis remanei]|uniref:F-box associated domain-containing protein n=1 Tax=Caenorhabditis remanei TaxID=31234 RepID=E3MNR7_CAERE|nr:hypothetical protein CRE_05915 [Caenorhabditis remanei]
MTLCSRKMSKNVRFWVKIPTINEVLQNPSGYEITPLNIISILRFLSSPIPHQIFLPISLSNEKLCVSINPHGEQRDHSFKIYISQTPIIQPSQHALIGSQRVPISHVRDSVYTCWNRKDEGIREVLAMIWEGRNELNIEVSIVTVDGAGVGEELRAAVEWIKGTGLEVMSLYLQDNLTTEHFEYAIYNIQPTIFLNSCVELPDDFRLAESFVFKTERIQFLGAEWLQLNNLNDMECKWVKIVICYWTEADIMQFIRNMMDGKYLTVTWALVVLRDDVCVNTMLEKMQLEGCPYQITTGRMESTFERCDGVVMGLMSHINNTVDTHRITMTVSVNQN